MSPVLATSSMVRIKKAGNGFFYVNLLIYITFYTLSE